VATKIRLMRLGKIRAPYYRIVVADSRTKRDGRVIETIGKYHPKQDPSLIEVDSDRARYWLSVGAQPTEPVAAILRVTGDWQAHKGLPAPSEGVKQQAARPDRKAIFEAAAKETLETAEKPAKKTTAKKAATKKSAAAAESSTDSTDSGAAEPATADAAPVDAATQAAPEAPAAETPPAETPAAEDAPVASTEAEPEPAAAQATESSDADAGSADSAPAEASTEE